jgi:hypothetical protein
LDLIHLSLREAWRGRRGDAAIPVEIRGQAVTEDCCVAALLAMTA